MARSRRSASQRAPRSSMTVEREAVVGAPPVIVRRALTEGELVKRWWSAWSGCAVDDATLDARPGGLYSVTSTTRYGTEHFVRGAFVELGASRIVVTWRTDLAPESVSVVSFDLESAGRRGTRVVLRHTELEPAEERMQMEEGWDRILAVMRRGIPLLRGEASTPEGALGA